MRVQHRRFKSSFKSWETLCDQASAFASELGRDRLINISVAQDAGQGVVIVWYWE